MTGTYCGVTSIFTKKKQIKIRRGLWSVLSFRVYKSRVEWSFTLCCLYTVRVNHQKRYTMSIEYYFVVILSLCSWCYVQSECCDKDIVVFVNLNETKSCSDYNNAQGTGVYCDVLGGLPNLCMIYVCGNGLPPASYFCGVGDCNIFGCNCDFGCIPGDRNENFSRQYGKEVYVVR